MHHCQVQRLLALVAANVLVDCSPLHLKSLTRFRLEIINERAEHNPSEIAAEWQGMLDRGEVRNRAALARTLGLSRARVTQVLGPCVVSSMGIPRVLPRTVVSAAPDGALLRADAPAARYDRSE